MYSGQLEAVDTLQVIEAHASRAPVCQEEFLLRWLLTAPTGEERGACGWMEGAAPPPSPLLVVRESQPQRWSITDKKQTFQPKQQLRDTHKRGPTFSHCLINLLSLRSDRGPSAFLQ